MTTSQLSTSTESTVTIAIGGMTCASCMGRVERSLGKVTGLGSAQVNLATESATVTFHPGGGDSRPPDHLSHPCRVHRHGPHGTHR